MGLATPPYTSWKAIVPPEGAKSKLPQLHSLGFTKGAETFRLCVRCGISPCGFYRESITTGNMFSFFLGVLTEWCRKASDFSLGTIGTQRAPLSAHLAIGCAFPQIWPAFKWLVDTVPRSPVVPFYPFLGCAPLLNRLPKKSMLVPLC